MRLFRKLSGLALAVASMAGVAGVSCAWAASPEVPDPNYKNLRYTDDFSHPDPNKAPDIWDKFKYVPLASSMFGKTYISFGGELRERFESYINPNFGIKAPTDSAYLLHRLQLHADLHLNDYVRAFVQFEDMDRLGKRGVTSTTDIDRGDISQGFVDLRLPTPLGNAPTFRVGREELLFGFQRLIAVREGPNTRRSFDGYRISDKWGDATIDYFAVRPVNNLVGAFDDNASKSQKLTGVYITVPAGPVMKADLYHMDYQNDTAKFRGLSGQELRETFGARLFGKYEGFDWNLEGAKQTGTFRSSDIKAHMLAGIVGYRFNALPWTPRVALEANYASGDDSHATSIGTFNAMYPRLPYFAELSLLVPTNVKDVRPVLEFNPRNDVAVVLGYDMMWRASTTDGLYGSGLIQYTGTASPKVTGAYIGTEISADVRWQVDQHLQLGAIATEIRVGPAATQALGKDVSFFVGYAKYKF